MQFCDCLAVAERSFACLIIPADARNDHSGEKLVQWKKSVKEEK
jgi:hypothetical protein